MKTNLQAGIMFMSSCIESVASAASGSRFTIESTASRKEEYGWHDGGLDLSSSWSTLPEIMSRDKTVRGATLDKITKERSAGRETGGNEHKDHAKRASANATKHARPERESAMLRKDDERYNDDRETKKYFSEDVGNHSDDSSSAACINASDSPNEPL
jgi:hypothetical protein